MENENKATYQISGEIVAIGETMTFSSGFQKRDVIIETSKNEQYPSPVRVTLKKDDVEKADTLTVGDRVNVEGEIDGRRWDGPKGTSWFVDLNVKSVMVTKKAENPSGSEGANANVTTWEALLAFAEKYGESKEDVTGRCKVYGKSFRAMEAKDWQFLADQIAGDNKRGQKKEEIPDDMPF